MFKNVTKCACRAVVVVMIGGLTITVPVSASAVEETKQPPNAMDQMPSMNPVRAKHDRVDMKQRVENCIAELHVKLKITSEQEAKWLPVTQVMRDNESAMSQLMMARHGNPEKLNAIEDLKSYESLVQAHADGLKRLMPVFEALYYDMTSEQQHNADQVFSRFEGHRGQMMTKKAK